MPILGEVGWGSPCQKFFSTCNFRCSPLYLTCKTPPFPKFLPPVWPMDSIDALQTLLHSTLALSLKTQNFHWNVRGPTFGPLHNLFGDQYTNLIEAADVVAERLRALDEFTHAHNTNSDAEAVDPILSNPPPYKKMLEILALDNQKLGVFCATCSLKLAEEDPATSNLLAERQMAHEKAAWMLRSHLTP